MYMVNTDVVLFVCTLLCEAISKKDIEIFIVTSNRAVCEMTVHVSHDHKLCTR